MEPYIRRKLVKNLAPNISFCPNVLDIDPSDWWSCYAADGQLSAEPQHTVCSLNIA